MLCCSLPTLNLCTLISKLDPPYTTSRNLSSKKKTNPSTTTTPMHSSAPYKLCSITTYYNLATLTGAKSPELVWELHQPPHGQQFTMQSMKTHSSPPGTQTCSSTVNLLTMSLVYGSVTPTLIKTQYYGHPCKTLRKNGMD